MRTYILTLIVLLTGYQLQAQQFSIKGKIIGQKTGILTLSYTGSDGSYTLDSAVIKDGLFEFKGALNEPVMAFFSGEVKSRSMDDPNAATFFIEPGQLTLDVKMNDFKNLVLRGSKTQDEYRALEKLKEPILQEMKPVSDAFQKVNEAYMRAKEDHKPDSELDALKEKVNLERDKFQPYRERQAKIELAFIASHPNSSLSAYLLRWKVASMSLNEARESFAKLSEKIKQSLYGKDVQKEIRKLESGSPGSIASVFTTQDINGQRLSLADFKGKQYVLLDFWASWCVPCRKGNPHLRSLYSKYKEKGFEIIGVSDDDSNHEAWKKAVAQDQIGVWKHVLRGLKRSPDGFDRSGDISEPYGIHSLPTKILIDKNGMIIGRYGGGGENDEALDLKLEQLFGKAK